MELKASTNRPLSPYNRPVRRVLVLSHFADEQTEAEEEQRPDKQTPRCPSLQAWAPSNLQLSEERGGPSSQGSGVFLTETEGGSPGFSPGRQSQ